MRLTYSDIKNQFLRNIGKQGSTDTTILADFQSNLNQRYQMIFSIVQNYQTQTTYTTTTVASTQYYSYPVGISKIDDVVITINGVNYPLNFVNSQHAWDLLNAIQIQPSAIPQFVFPRRDDYGIWPIPKDAYTITFYRFIRDRSLAVDDYTTGTITAVNGDATITGSGTVFATAMADRWLQVTDITDSNYDWWYRISSVTSGTALELDTPWQGSTISSGVAYRIGQTPELPEEGHICLADGVTADWYAGPRADTEKATLWNNKFWTGDMNNNNRKLGDDNIKSGVIGLYNKYSSRDELALVYRQKKLWPPQYKIWATNLS